MTNDILHEMEALVAKLNEASDAYYNGRGELMTDYEWDAAFDRLRSLEQTTGTVLPDSPTHNVSADTVVGQKEAHEYPALSLAKTKSVAELAKWAEERPIWLSWKLDGLTLVVTYDRGRLTKVVTRGNGHIGTNITHLAPAIEGIPPQIAYQGHLVVRGEAVISYQDFERFNMESDEEYANPRNLASGSLTLKDVEEAKQRHLHWIPFTLVHLDDDILSWGARMDWLDHEGFTTVERELIPHPSTDSLQAVVDRWTEKVTSRAIAYPVDGLVIGYDDTAYAQTGSVTGHHATRAGYAFKWQDEAADTVLDHIEWSCATSLISPVAVFQPVELEGTTVRRASLCNISECERLGIGGQGSRLRVIKANKIIPKVISVTEAIGPFAIPSACPVCGAPTRVCASEATGTKTLRCSNSSCPAKQLRKFARFVSKEGVNIDGMSEQTVLKMINLGWLKEYADFFQLRSRQQALAALGGFGQRSATKLMAAIDKARTVKAEQLLYALSIPLCGHDVCHRLLSHYTLAELMEQAANTADTALFAHVQGIGPEKSAQVVSWFHDERNHQQVVRLLQEISVSEENPDDRGTRCDGLTFVVTGEVHHYKGRSALKAYIESQGGKVAGSVSGKTNYLINNDNTSTSAKNVKARQLGIPVITEEEFIRRFATSGEEPAANSHQEGDLFA